ncbi:hypothetical protein RUM44_013630 [Polyplax serrata]|uniref:Uncharacterized protein n=1 Tax=Polyplax serrata TaxID=468196 RepID=A0ABR1BEP1_POLSC
MGKGGREADFLVGRHKGWTSPAQPLPGAPTYEQLQEMGRNLVYRAVTCRSCVALGLATFGTNAPRPERSDKLAVARVPASSIAESLGSRTSAQDKMVPMTGSNWL